MRDYFYAIADDLQSLMRGEEVWTASYTAEDSDFVRFNHNRVRQAGSVQQRVVSIDLIQGRRHAAASTTLSGDLEIDRPRLRTIPHAQEALPVVSAARHAQDIGPETGRGPRHFRKLDIVADRDRHDPEVGLEYAQSS